MLGLRTKLFRGQVDWLMRAIWDEDRASGSFRHNYDCRVGRPIGYISITSTRQALRQLATGWTLRFSVQ